MKITLLTYDSTVAFNAGYLPTTNVLEAIRVLNEWATKFANEVGIPLKAVYWKEVQHSDWCKFCVIFYATVPRDWVPTADTFIYDDVCESNWLATTFGNWLSGNGRSTNYKNNPPSRPHNLFKSKTI